MSISLPVRKFADRVNRSWQRKWWHTLALEPDFYKRQLSRLLLLALVSVVLSSVILAFFYSHLLDQLAVSGTSQHYLPDELEQLSDSLPGLVQTLAIWIVVLSIVTGVSTVFTGIFMLARLAGPLYRLKKSVARLGEGDLSVLVELRDGDEFHDLADDLNGAAARIQLMVMACKENLALMEQAQREEINDERLDSAIQGLEQALTYFNTVDPFAPPAKDTHK